MHPINWSLFAKLPGAVTSNFEKLCRALIRRHYARFGDFRALANQPGVEFHLKLRSPCSLGDTGRWYGWQCRWYELPSGRAIGGTRRRKIIEAVHKTEQVLPELTDWVLWTRHPLTAADQKWFNSLKTRMRLGLWTESEVEEHLSGPAEILRSTHFGELVLTPDVLRDCHARAVASIKGKWHPEVHQVVAAERELNKALGVSSAWSDLSLLAARLASEAEVLRTATRKLSPRMATEAVAIVHSALSLSDSLMQTSAAIDCADLEIAQDQITNHVRPNKGWSTFSRGLRANRHELALQVTNLLADMYGAVGALLEVSRALKRDILAVIADAGYGKTQLAAQLTSESTARPAGVLLHGRDLDARQNLDDLASRVSVNGTRIQTFEALVAALDAAGQRAGIRLPIVIDGLNEAEDPRNWKTALASVRPMLQKYPHVLLLCTLRRDFVRDAIPDDVEQLRLPGFNFDLVEAVRRYFGYYRIDWSDATLHWEMFNHPLLLRMFCEVTNPDRAKHVGLEAMPSSLAALFDRYLDQVAERIGVLSHWSHRYCASDVRSALSRIGLALWDAKARSIEKATLQKLLQDEARPWSQSIVRALEHDGVLIRESRSEANAGRYMIVYDALAGHIVADALLEQHGGDALESWLVQPETAQSLTHRGGNFHPLAGDIMSGLIGLMPRRRHRQQLWPLLPEPMRTEALCQAAWLEAQLLDKRTVSELSRLVPKSSRGQYDLFDRLWRTRAARNHPLDSEFLDSALRPMPAADRDLCWTEWIRRRQTEIVENMIDVEERWQHVEPGLPHERLRARWVMWTLTSTVRILRDHATRALYTFGCNDPTALFELCLDSLSVNDPYVPERMLSACYGAAMSLWADPKGDAVRAALPSFARSLVDCMFVPGAPHGTRHALMKDSALGIISLARRVKPNCIGKDLLAHLAPPFDHLPSPFVSPEQIRDSELVDAQYAIQMDFGNYTIGGLIPERGNYDDRHPTYKAVRRQIEARIVQLGFSATRFKDIDKDIVEENWQHRSREQSLADRYGKKYSWIAYFEMYGLRGDKGELSEWRANERCSNVDIDPSFPQPGRNWVPQLPSLFKKATRELKKWIAKGPTPSYEHLLNPHEIDGQKGPWTLVEGYIEQSATSDERRVWTLLRGLLVTPKNAHSLRTAFKGCRYPGNSAIPDLAEDYYTYAGEIPWSYRFGSALRKPSGGAQRATITALDYFDGTKSRRGIKVEIPVCRFSWESYHSRLNQVNGIVVPAPAICEYLKLLNRKGEWDLYEANGQLATLYREFKGKNHLYSSRLAYVRSDLLADYLRKTKQILVWLLWGERGIDLRDRESTKGFEHLFSRNLHIHRKSATWSPRMQTRDK